MFSVSPRALIDLLPRKVASISPSIRTKVSSAVKSCRCQLTAPPSRRDVHINNLQKRPSVCSPVTVISAISIADQTEVREVVGLPQREITFGVVRRNHWYEAVDISFLLLCLLTFARHWRWRTLVEGEGARWMGGVGR